MGVGIELSDEVTAAHLKALDQPFVEKWGLWVNFYAPRSAFGMAAIDGGSIVRTVTIRNSGADTLTVSSVCVAGNGFSVSTQAAVSVGPSGSSTFVMTFAPSKASAAAGTVTFTTNDTDEASYSFAINALALSPAKSWRLTHFGEIANSGNGADLADPDGDGLRNVFEYGFTLDANTSSASGRPTLRVNVGGYLEIQFARNTGRTDLTYTIEASSDLVTWTPIAIITAGAATAGSPRFLRLKIVRNQEQTATVVKR